MDMPCTAPLRRRRTAPFPAGTEILVLAESRRRVFALIREFQVALLRHNDLDEAAGILAAIRTHSGAYFARVEFLLDAVTAPGAAARRADHHRILDEMQETLDQCQSGGARPALAAMTHALDAFVMHETALRPRPGALGPPKS